LHQLCCIVRFGHGDDHSRRYSLVQEAIELRAAVARTCCGQCVEQSGALKHRQRGSFGSQYCFIAFTPCGESFIQALNRALPLDVFVSDRCNVTQEIVRETDACNRRSVSLSKNRDTGRLSPQA